MKPLMLSVESRRNSGNEYPVNVRETLRAAFYCPMPNASRCILCQDISFTGEQESDLFACNFRFGCQSAPLLLFDLKDTFRNAIR